jgi:hypothetical protein
MTDPDPSNPSGFVRVRAGSSPNGSDPIIGSNLHIDLGWGWSYREDD